MDAAAAAEARTELVELTEDECWHLLRAGTVGRVAVNVGTAPDVFPVNYVVRADEIVIHTEAGTKLAAATLMPSVAFEIDAIDGATRTGWSVVAKGPGREPTSLEELVELDELGVVPWVSSPKSRWLVVSPTQVTGRRIDLRSG
jgi:nitroimidazol reductase NimA-like FMN-containing flavoprotein (pyridoxamine 5'-phosphate oxidase superfamily)